MLPVVPQKKPRWLFQLPDLPIGVARTASASLAASAVGVRGVMFVSQDVLFTTRKHKTEVRHAALTGEC